MVDGLWRGNELRVDIMMGNAGGHGHDDELDTSRSWSSKTRAGE